MSGTTVGAKKAVRTIEKRYGKGYWHKLGVVGGNTLTEHTKMRGFGTNRDLAKRAGAIGGRISRRRPRPSFWDEYRKANDQPFELPKRRGLWSKVKGFWENE